MEMKHLGLTLRATVCAQSPGAGLHWAPRHVRTRFVVWAYVSTCPHMHTVYIGGDETPWVCHVKVTLEGTRGRERPPACRQWQNEGDSHPPVSEHSHSRLHLHSPSGMPVAQGTLWPSLSSSWLGILSNSPRVSWNHHHSPLTSGHSGQVLYCKIHWRVSQQTFAVFPPLYYYFFLGVIPAPRP